MDTYQTEDKGIKTDEITRKMIISRLRREGCRITHQRSQILDVILGEECATIKEICSRARKQDPSIGFATVYRMVSLLEQIGLVSRGIVINYDEIEKLKNEDPRIENRP
ncbi:MAG: transcriptional repressor [Lachnospiraceae bacterium]|nr:transcriptional repressor [Lachnospiraceae bacterium]